MAQKDEKFYWLKLDRHFFDRHDIKIIKNMPNGKDYLIFYLQLLCESIDHNGELRFSDTIPYNEEMLASLTNTNIDIVRSAVKIFVESQMMTLQDDKTIYMKQIEKMIGSETYWARQKQKQKETTSIDSSFHGGEKQITYSNQREENETVGNFPTQFQQSSNDSISISNSISNSIDNNIPKEKEKRIEIKIDDIIENIRKIFKKYDFSAKFHKTATTKKLKTILNAPTKSKRLYPLQIFLAYNLYLSQQYENDKEVDYIKGSEVFLSNEVYDYAEKTNTKFNAEMENKYGTEWQKLKFDYRE